MRIDVEIRREEARMHLLGYSACAMAGSLWGTGFFLGKIALREMSVGHMVLWRFLFACVALVPFALRHPPHFSRREWKVLLFGSLLGVPVQFLIQFDGLAHTTASHASLMVGTLPVILAGGAAIFQKERLDWLGWLALLGSSFGVALIVLGGRQAGTGPGPSARGDLLVVFSMVVSVGWILVNKQLMIVHAPIVVTAYGLICGSAMLAVWVLLRDGPPPMRGISLAAWLALAGSGLLCTALTTLLWNWGIHRVPTSRAGVFLNIEPMLGSLLGVTLLGDHLGPFAWVGGGTILAAAATLTTRPDARVSEVILE